MGIPALAEEHTSAGRMIVTLPMASQDKFAHSTPGPREAKGKRKARIGLRSAPNLAHVVNVNSASEAGDKQPKSWGSATKMNVKPGMGTQRTRSGRNFPRTHSTTLLRLRRGGKVVNKKRQSTEQSTQKTVSTGTDVDGKPTCQRPKTGET